MVTERKNVPTYKLHHNTSLPPSLPPSLPLSLSSPPSPSLPPMQSWKKRWFVLSRTNPSDSSSLDLSYYSDCEKKDKKGSIDFLKMRSVNPVYNKSNDNVFSVEMVDRKFMLKSPDKQGKAVWVAKLLECCSKGNLTYSSLSPLALPYGGCAH